LHAGFWWPDGFVGETSIRGIMGNWREGERTIVMPYEKEDEIMITILSASPIDSFSCSRIQEGGRG